MVNLASEAVCTGCGACVNVCPVGAIKMKYSNMGFMIPEISSACIGCNKCVNTCPVLCPKENEGNKKPEFFSLCAKDEIREKSSSGGMFSLLAEMILKQGGYVCGACFDENMVLKHVVTNDRDIIDKMKGSKYLQSDVGYVYKEIKMLLEKNIKVLFVGTPCQVAGLKSTLKEKYEELLITVDLLCHGTPSQKTFDSYIKDFAKGKKVVDVQFRSKRFGWSYSNFIIQFEDGMEYVTKKDDPYKNGFIKALMNRYSCYDCQFATYPRQGDITIGDLWKSEELDPASNDKKGTSFVFVNTAVGKLAFQHIMTEAKYVNQIRIEDEQYEKLPNRVNKKHWMNPNRKRFLNMVQRKSFSEAYSYVEKGIYDIGMLGYMCTPNIGSALTYYAFYHVLTDMGYEVLPIERPKDSSMEISSEAVEFFKKWLPTYAQPVQSESILDMRKYNDICSKFVVGSDQIWLESSAERRNHYCFGQWIDCNKPKIAYATSFGGPGARGCQKFYNELEYYLNKFYKISCRETDGVNFANNKLNLDSKVELVLDPVFLANANIYMKLIKSVKVNRTSEYIGGYVIKPKQTFYSLVDKAKKHFQGLSVELIGESVAQIHTEKWGFEHKKNFPVEATLERIYNSKFFITDSYHGVCFCIILKKDFLVMPRDFVDRFTTLLNKLGLGNRIIKENHSNLTEKSFKPIDWDAVYEKLRVEIGISKHWLKDALEGDPQMKFSYADVDILMEFIRKQEDKIKELQNEIELLKNK